MPHFLSLGSPIGWLPCSFRSVALTLFAAVLTWILGFSAVELQFPSPLPALLAPARKNTIHALPLLPVPSLVGHLPVWPQKIEVTSVLCPCP